MNRLIASVLLVLLSGPLMAQDAPLSVEGLATRNARLLVAGVAYGFFTFDAALDEADQERLYCPPPNFEISGNTLWEIAEEELDGEHDLATVAATVLARLRTLYPCSG